MHIYDFKAKDLDKIIDFFIKHEGTNELIGITAGEIQTSFEGKGEDQIDLMLRTISIYNVEIIRKAFFQTEDRGVSYETGAFFKEFVERGKFRKLFKRDRFKKIFDDLKRVWLQYLLSILALIISFFTWFFPKDTNQNLSPLENQIKQLQNKNHIQDSLINFQNQEIKLLQKVTNLETKKGKEK